MEQEKISHVHGGGIASPHNHYQEKEEIYCIRCGRLKEHIRVEKDKMCSSTAWGKTIHFGINHKYK